MSNPSRAAAIASLLLLPLLWLWPCVFGGRTFVPYDTAEFPPASLSLSAEQLAAARDGANHDVTEVPPWFLPELRLARDELRAGRLPAWDPHARGGAPLHAHGLIGLAYPPNWLALFADDPASRLVFLAWISLALGGATAFGLLRAVGVTPLAAWFGAALFELSGPMATNGFFWMRLASFAWLPGLLWALLALARPAALRPLPLAAVALAFAMTWLGGFPPFATTTTVLGGAWCAWLIVERARAAGGPAALRLALRLCLGLALGTMLALPQVLPSLQFFPQSARTTDPRLQDIAGSAFEAYGLLGYLAPDLVSHPTATHAVPYQQSALAFLLNWRTDAAGRATHPNYNYTEYAVFVGTLGFLLAVAGACVGRGRLRSFPVAGWLLLLAMALFLPGANLLFHLPVIKNVWPMRWPAAATLLVAWLAALGLERLLQAERRLPLALGAAAIGLAAALWYGTSRPEAWHASDPAFAVRLLAERFAVQPIDVVNHMQAGAPPGLDRFAASFARAAVEGRQAALWLVAVGGLLLAVACARRAAARAWLVRLGCGLTVVQLALHGAPILRGRALAQPTDTAVHAFLRERARQAAPAGGFTIARASTVPAMPVQLPPGQLMEPGIRDLHFYTHYDGRSHQPLLAMLGPHWGPIAAAKGYLTLTLPDALPAPGEPPRAVPYAFASPLEHPLLDLLGVRYVLASEPLQHAGARVGPPLRGPGGEFFVYERPHPMPRAFTVPTLRALPDDDAVVAALADPALAPAAAAFVRASDLADRPAEPAAAVARRDVRFVVDHPTVVELDVGAGDAPWLVLTDTWLPGWTASVDAATAPILRCNHSQRLVRLPPHACRVRFVYASPGLSAGLAAAGIATLALLGLGAFAARRSGGRSRGATTAS